MALRIALHIVYEVVHDWREKFEQPDLHFGSCLLAPWKKSQDIISFPELRIAHANLTAHVPRTFTISTLDGGAQYLTINQSCFTILKLADRTMLVAMASQ